jgi:radical SAM superfamily enzyme YgiQ (UPF0313 family)
VITDHRRVLLVSPNIESLPDPVFPIGLASLAGSLTFHGIEHRILDLCFEEDHEEAVRRAVASFNPGLVALSIRNVDNVAYPHSVSYLPFYRYVVRAVRRYGKGRIVLGGSGFSLLPGPLMRYLGADVGIVGEGEHALVRLVNDLSSGKVVPRGTVLQGDPIPDLDRLPEPDRSGFDLAAYLEKGGMGNIQTKKGCPFGCIYCTYPLIEGKRVRLRSPARVADEIEGLLEQGVDTLFVVDNTFNHPVDHAEAVCGEIRQRGLPVRWSCYAEPGHVEPGLIETMIEAGCTGVEFGSDAAEEGMLRNLGKGFTVEDLASASNACRSAGISFCHSLLLGGPGETMDTLRRTVETVAGMDPTAVICMAGIRILPGTGLARRGAEEGLVGPDESFLRPVFYLSPAVRDGLLPFLEAFSKKHPTWIFPGLQINMRRSLMEKLRRFGVKGPLWEYMRGHRP